MKHHIIIFKCPMSAYLARQSSKMLGEFCDFAYLLCTQTFAIASEIPHFELPNRESERERVSKH